MMIPILLCACAVILVSADSTPQLKNARAREAAIAYARQTAKAEEECNEKMEKARRTYRDALVQAEAMAIKAADLDDANGIRDLIRSLDEQSEAATGNFTITEARWGINGKWTDFTKAAQSRIVGDALPGLGALPDPAVGQLKTIVIKANYGGRPLVFICDTGNPLAAFYLGKPPRGAEPK